MNAAMKLFTSRTTPYEEHRESFRHKAAFITGCDSGFGYSMAVFCRETLGMTVVAGCHMRNSNTGAKELEGKGVHVVGHFDVTDGESVERARAETDEVLEREGAELWCVINNAATLVFGETEWQTAEQISMQFEVNVVGPLVVAKAFLPLLRRSRGRIINMTSNSASDVVPAFSVYSASKAALEAVSEGFRLELKKFGVDVVLLDPGNNPEKTPLCGRQKLYHAQMRAEMRSENAPVFGDYFWECSERICGLFAPPADQPAANEDPEFYRLLFGALHEARPCLVYRSRSIWDQIVTFFKWLLFPRWLKDQQKLKMVPLPEFKQK